LPKDNGGWGLITLGSHHFTARTQAKKKGLRKQKFKDNKKKEKENEVLRRNEKEILDL
jgi:hypothetical protein